MSYTVLARKYRSQTFDDVIGQDPIARTLKNAIRTDRVAHAYLFVGTRGVGKTTVARLLAKSLNCLGSEKPTTEPCCKCDSCRAVNLGEDIDVIEIDGASNNRVDEIRELRENVIYRPARSRFKIYIIDEVHMLTPGAFNALLKTLEEPPSHVKFIFATTEPNKVIPTIQSRCQRFDFSNIGVGAIAEQLKSILKREKIKYEDDLILPLAKMANGSMRDGLSLLDRLISAGEEPLTAKLLEEFLGCPDSEKIRNLISAIGDSDAGKTLEGADAFLSTGTTEVQIIGSLIDYMRDLMVAKSAGVDSELLILTSEQREQAAELAEKFDVAALVYNIASLEKLRFSIKHSDSPRPLLEAWLLRFALAEHFLNVDELLSRLEGVSSAAVKKKRPVNDDVAGRGTENRSTPVSAVRAPATSVTGAPAKGPLFSPGAQSSSMKDDWPVLLKAVGAKLGAATAGLLSSATPERREKGILVLRFGASARMQMQMCQRNGRAEQIEALLAEQLNEPVTVRFELGADAPAAAAPKAHGVSAKKRSEILSDPAVKTVLTELDATITDIEEA